MPAEDDHNDEKKIVIQPDGPYLVQGDVPLVRKIQVVSEYGEPLTWQKEGGIETEREYCLCRCGHSNEKPFCDGTHNEIGFDGTEDADIHTTAERRMVIPGGTHLVVKRDFALCMASGFCGLRDTNVDELTPKTDDTQVRSLVMAMIERCPSGSYAYSIEKDGPDVEPDLPQEIAVSIEITSTGPIAGPLWVTGNIPVERADGQPFETRNRVTLCSCGRSHSKPLCDGTHRLQRAK